MNNRYNNDIINKFDKIRKKYEIKKENIKIVEHQKKMEEINKSNSKIINNKNDLINLTNIFYKTIKDLTNYEVSNINLNISCDINNKNDKIIISLTTIPTRFILDDFNICIDSLINQKLHPDYIIINICNEYKRIFNYDINKYNNKIKTFCSKYNNVYINRCTDYGPATKLLGIFEFK